MVDQIRASFLRLFAELDGSRSVQNRAVTIACIEALLDWLLNPPQSGPHEPPTSGEVDQTVSALHQLVERKAERVRQVIRGAGRAP